MGNVTAQKLAVEFVRILGEGWNPDPDEFLNRVPQEHREECRRHIEELAELNGLGLTPQTPEPQPGREGGAEEPDSALPEEQAHDDHGLEWIEKQVVSSGAGADAVAFSIVPKDPQPAVAAEEDVATEAPTERSPRAAPVVRVKRAIDELWGHVGAERGVAEADLPAPKGLLSVADELCRSAGRPARSQAASKSEEEREPRSAAIATEPEPEPVSAEEAMEMWRVQRRLKRPDGMGPLR